MGRVAVLPAEVSDRIAAGEVVERPASVVKELLENALDAGARRVQVELADGGIGEIAVTDDGCGMDPEDAVAAFARHATSKLARLEDLGALRTLGFRGEALPSIATVARVRLTTRPPDALEGTAVEAPPGGRPTARPAGAPPGTRVVVGDIFDNLPARRAALRSRGAELAACGAVVTAAALARPDVAFHFAHNGRQVLATPGAGDLLAAVVAIWGPEIGRAMRPVEGGDGGWRVGGVCGAPAVTRGSRGLQYLSVDGRPVRAEGVRGAVEAAYRHRVMAGRYPVFVLRLESAPGGYDPNVHPSKREVRIYRVERVREMCHRAVRAALAASEAAVAMEVAPAPREQRPTGRQVGFALEAQAAEAAEAYFVPQIAAQSIPGRLPPLRPLGQIGSAYLVAEGPDGCYLVDQHAAHERVSFEELAGDGAAPGRALLRPAAVPLSPAQWERWQAVCDDLRGVGLAAEDFGDGTLLVRALPAGVDPDPAAAVSALLEHVEGSAAGPLEARRALAACKAAIKAGQALAAEEASALLERLAACADPFHCPHGRPTVLRVGLDELERHFGRR